ncbi:hypothetical protein [Caldicellulosiruptor acetigenus]|uniref:hypothetical protein n=1 Tax=Caldicellulosiruptor acetigenus TaxID=301953 RepID=UPI000413E027|nr:hypothetical protein [Caldicellulosiruptor acetigenus]WAM36282.1 hypothetical protein OTK01_000035 [Caldicellulosiruptor acetigenus]
MHESEMQILSFLKKVQRRQMLCSLLTRLWQCVSASLSFVILIEALSKIVPMYYKSFYQIFIFLLSLVIYAIFIILRKPTLEHSALLIDSFGLKERLTTALELIGVDTEISRYIKQTTAQIIKNLNIKRLIKPRFEKDKWMFVASLFIVFFIITNVHSPKMDEAKRIHAFNELKKEEITRIEKQKKEVLKSYKLNEAEKRKIDEVLLKLKKEIKLAKTRSEIELARQKTWFLLNDLKSGSKNSQFYSAVEKLKNLVAHDNNSNQRGSKDSLASANTNSKSEVASGSAGGQGSEQKSQDERSNASFSEKEGSEAANRNLKAGSENETSNASGSDASANSVQNASGQGADGGMQGGDGAISQVDNLNSQGSGLGAAIPRTSNKVEVPSVYTKNLLCLDASKKVLADTGQESGRVSQKQGIGERGQKLSFDKVFSQYKQEANEYIEADEVPSWAKEITKRYFENLENTR